MTNRCRVVLIIEPGTLCVFQKPKSVVCVVLKEGKIKVVENNNSNRRYPNIRPGCPNSRFVLSRFFAKKNANWRELARHD